MTPDIAEIDDLLKRLFPICRSITGNGVRETLSIISSAVTPLEIEEVPSGTRCYDWTVPDEWNVRDAFIANEAGERLVDFRQSNLHLVGYSEPVDRWMDFAELEGHLHRLPGQPRAIPYRTSYFKRDWGFCVTEAQYQALRKTGQCHVVIDSDLETGSLTYGEAMAGGAGGREYLVTTYCCHPSLANDNLSGLVLWSFLLRDLRTRDLRHRYRFVVTPETIGAIAYLSRNEEAMRDIEGGLVVTTVAGPGPLGYKRTFEGGHLIDRAVRRAFAELGDDFVEYPFDIGGSDERQYSSPAFRIPMGTVCKDKYYEYDEYHTSGDDLDFISAENLRKTYAVYARVIDILEANRTFESLNPHCEPQLGRRGLYPSLGGAIGTHAGGTAPDEVFDALRWLLFACDGTTDLLSIAETTGLSMDSLSRAAARLVENDLLAPCEESVSGRTAP